MRKATGVKRTSIDVTAYYGIFIYLSSEGSGTCLLMLSVMAQHVNSSIINLNPLS